MSDTPRPIVAIGQVESARDPEVNLEKAATAVATASDHSASMIVFPEYFMSWGPGRHDGEAMRAVAQRLDRLFVSALSALASQHGIAIVAGMIEEADDNSQLPYNTTVVLDSDGKLQAAYRKSHLFDAFGHQESSIFSTGDALFDPVDTVIGRIGVFVCYELRFPEVARCAVRGGAEVLIVPSAWVAGPMKDLHWRTLIQARAIENGCYVVAAAQVGNEFSGMSLIVDPQGTVVSAAGALDEALISATIKPELVVEVRRRVPATTERREDMYDSRRDYRV